MILFNIWEDVFHTSQANYLSFMRGWVCVCDHNTYSTNIHELNKQLQVFMVQRKSDKVVCLLVGVMTAFSVVSFDYRDVHYRQFAKYHIFANSPKYQIFANALRPFDIVSLSLQCLMYVGPCFFSPERAKHAKRTDSNCV